MSTTTLGGLASAPIAALVLSFGVVFAGGQIAYSWSTPVITKSGIPPTSLTAREPNLIVESTRGTFDLGTVQADTTFAESELNAVVVQQDDGRYSVCITPPQGTTMDDDEWTEHGDRVSQYCRQLHLGEHVIVKVKS